jgi:hypothetical protein
MILIKSTLKMFICLYVRFYLFLKLKFLLRFLDSLKKLYFVCLQFNKHNSYLYRGQYQDIQTALGSWYGPWNRCFPRLRFGQYHFHWYVPRPLNSLYILILPSISVTIIEVYTKPGKCTIMYMCVRGIKPGKCAIMYMCVRGIDFSSFY